jgi:UDP-glucose 4-epimerase
MHILVTGGAGYIGSIVCEMLEKTGHDIIVIDDLRDGKLLAVPETAIFYQENFGNNDVLDLIFEQFPVSHVFHFAASANVPHSKVDPFLYYDNNVSNTINLLGAMKRHSVKNLVFSSTAAVYGEPIHIPIDEFHPLIPINPYGSSKLMCEEIIRDFHSAYGINFVIFRYFCAAGATGKRGEARDHETHIIPLVIDTILAKKEVFEVFGNDYNTADGTGVRDYIHVTDIAAAHIKAMEWMDNGNHGIFNLGTEKGFSVLEVIRATEKLFNKKLNYKISPKRDGDPASLVATYKNALTSLNWKPQKNLSEIIQSVYEWRTNPLF